MLSLGIDLTKEKMDLTLLRGPHFRGLLQAFANEKELEVGLVHRFGHLATHACPGMRSNHCISSHPLEGRSIERPCSGRNDGQGLEVLSRPHLLVVLTPIDAAQKTTNFKQALGTDIDDLMERGGQPRRWWEP